MWKVQVWWQCMQRVYFEISMLFWQKMCGMLCLYTNALHHYIIITNLSGIDSKCLKHSSIRYCERPIQVESYKSTGTKHLYDLTSASSDVYQTLPSCFFSLYFNVCIHVFVDKNLLLFVDKNLLPTIFWWCYYFGHGTVIELW